jgi:hypothetical protein
MWILSYLSVFKPFLYVIFFFCSYIRNLSVKMGAQSAGKDPKWWDISTFSKEGMLFVKAASVNAYILDNPKVIQV